MKKVLIIFLSIFLLVSCGADKKEIKEELDSLSIDNKIVENTISEEVKQELSSIDKIDKYNKYELDCDKYNTDEGKEYCFNEKIDSHLFFLFRGISSDEIYKMNCKEKFSITNWPDIGDGTKDYIEKCEKELMPYIESNNKTNKSSEIKISDCSDLVLAKFSEDTKEKQNELIEQCKIGLVVKYNKSCDILEVKEEIGKCIIIKSDIEEYSKIIEKEMNYNKYKNLNLELFIK